MTDDLTYTFTVDQSPAVAFAAINDVGSWWSGDIEGDTEVLGAEWTYRVPDVHLSKQRITELVAGRSVAWLVIDGWLSFVEDEQEWVGTTIRFDLSPTASGGTEVRFTHVGLRPQVECFGVCKVAWGEYILGSLRQRIESGTGRPDSYGGDKLNEAKERAAKRS
jgi:hypothetical protein